MIGCRLRTLLLAVLATCCTQAWCAYHEIVTDLHEKFFGNGSRYNKDVPPQETITVQLRISPKSLTSMDIGKQTMTMKYNLAVYWADGRIRWNPGDYGNVSMTFLNPEKIWVPPIYVENKVTSEGLLFSNMPAKATYRGGVTWRVELSTEMECRVSTKHYPFDKQTCAIRISAWTTTNSMTFELAETPLSFDQCAENGEWLISDWRSEKANVKVQHVDATLPRVQFRFTLERRTSYYVLAIILPVLLLSVLIVAVFWVPIESGEKIGYCLTILLTYTLFLSIVSDELPPIATDVSYLQFYLAVSMALGVVASLLTTLVLHLYHKGQAPVPGWLKGLTKHLLLPVTRLRCTGCRKNSIEPFEDSQGEYLPPKQEEAETKELAVSYQMVAMALDRFFLLIYTVIMLAFNGIVAVCMIQE